MIRIPPGVSGPAGQARAARGLTEAALDSTGWRWSDRLNRWLDALVLLEEQGA